MYNENLYFNRVVVSWQNTGVRLPAVVFRRSKEVQHITGSCCVLAMVSTYIRAHSNLMLYISQAAHSCG